MDPPSPLTDLDTLTDDEMIFLKSALNLALAAAALPRLASPLRRHASTLRSTAPLNNIAAAAVAPAIENSVPPPLNNLAAAAVASVVEGSVRPPINNRAAAAVAPVIEDSVPSPLNNLAPDIEDSVPPPPPSPPPLAFRSLFERFRSGRGLMVTDLTATEWCEKQMELILEKGKPRKTKAMKAGSARHSELEKEVVDKVIVDTKSSEDIWAVKLSNFIHGVNQLMFGGLTRELPVIGVVEGVWVTGVIDEIRMPLDGVSQNLTLVDTKTRIKPTLPSEAQTRNSRLQMMCYKFIWDFLVTDQFPKDYFFSHFKLNPRCELSDDVKHHTASLGFQTLEDVVTCFMETCLFMTTSQEQLLLRYESQSDRSLIGEDQFDYDGIWFRHKVLRCYEFWSGVREADYVALHESWKCRFCDVSSFCPKMASSPKKS